MVLLASREMGFALLFSQSVPAGTSITVVRLRAHSARTPAILTRREQKAGANSPVALLAARRVVPQAIPKGEWTSLALAAYSQRPAEAAAPARKKRVREIRGRPRSGVFPLRACVRVRLVPDEQGLSLDF
jgi:hypothetical protein